jgi:hypothetical protein
MDLNPFDKNGAAEDLQYHIELLQDRGYLDPNFKAGDKVGAWIQGFQQLFDMIKGMAVTDGKNMPLTTDLWGSFNEDLEKVRFMFKYNYDPHLDSLTLLSVRATLHKETIPVFLDQSADLPLADAFYQCLRNPESEKQDRQMYLRLIYQFFKHRDPDNDYTIPSKSDVNPATDHIKMDEEFYHSEPKRWQAKTIRR